MFDCISKKEYWSILNQEPVWKILKSSPPDLKHIQDTWMWSQLRAIRSLKIIEVGGGNSRVLPALDRSNELWNIDEFTGSDGGPNKIVERPGEKTIMGSLGTFSENLPSDYFDVAFSISVIEHVPSGKEIENFFKDHSRILKKGGRGYHAIDIYLEDDYTPYASARLKEYVTAIEKSEHRFLETPVITDRAKFSCRYASNPDLAMYGWNKAVPQLASVREVSQSCSLKLVIEKQ